MPWWTIRREVVECDYPGDPRKRRVIFVNLNSREKQAKLPEIEKFVEQQRRVKKISADENSIGGMLYLPTAADDESKHFPFDRSSRFLGATGHDLFRKLLVVRSSSDNGQQWPWNDLIDAGMRIVEFDGTHESAWSAGMPTVAALSSASSTEAAVGDKPSQTLAFNTCQDDDEGVPLDLGARAYTEAGHIAGRHAHQAVILTVGHSGHGKSKTINRLIGRNLLEIGKVTLGSTTKVIQRVSVLLPVKEKGVTVKIAFDDTPGLEDTTFGDRATNASLMRRYREQYFPENTLSLPDHRRQTYPNVILLVAAWNSITPDAHNDPEHFTSALGKSMYNLQFSGLVDRERPNVLVVVTKSLSFWNQFVDCKGVEQMNAQWRLEADKRIAIIADLQRKVFPKLTLWRTVFVENGGGMDMRAEYSILPNGELSHQNLFEAIRDVIASPGQLAGFDPAGLHALCFLSGAEPFDLASKAETEILVQRSTETMMDSEVITIPHSHVPSFGAMRRGFAPSGPYVGSDLPGMDGAEPLASEAQTEVLVEKSAEAATDSEIIAMHYSHAPSDRIRELTDTYLGVTYDPIRGSFGRSCVLTLKPSDVRFTLGSGNQTQQFVHMEDIQEDKRNTAKRLNCEFDIGDVAGLTAHYSSSSALRSVMTRKSQLYLHHHAIAEVRIASPTPRLSQEFLGLIERLPPWSEESKEQYYEFFSNYGTHVVLRLVLGGILRLVSFSRQDTKEHARGRGSIEQKSPVLDRLGAKVGAALRGSLDTGTSRCNKEHNITMFCDGGDAVASQLTHVLEAQFSVFQSHLSSFSPCLLPGWTDVRRQWIEELDKDAVLCPDHDDTEYRWIHTLGGLTKDQESDLRAASQCYLTSSYTITNRRCKEDLPPPQQPSESP
ncbi:Protein hedgehog [Mycena venus]|uniref:Protein hedgehog n=1 Tax=Mycena venus TaxID=2733690 RepID=A0A8H6X6P8_9AGAR|nr:Protein hedgehog [Mycena venus]